MTSTAIMLQSGKTAIDIGNLSRDRDMLDTSAYATHTLPICRVRWSHACHTLTYAGHTMSYVSNTQSTLAIG